MRDRTRGGEHVPEGVGDHGGLLVDEELETLGADELDHARHLLRFLLSFPVLRRRRRCHGWED